MLTVCAYSARHLYRDMSAVFLRLLSSSSLSYHIPTSSLIASSMSAFQTHLQLPRPHPFRSRSVCQRCRAPVRSVTQNAAVSSSVKPSQKPTSVQSQSITPRHEDYSQWYLDVITAADLSESAPVKGCLVIKPHGYAIWELLRDKLDSAIKASGAKNAYFPLLIPQSFLSKEAEHVEGFAKECAVVTHHRLRADPDGPPGTLQPDPDAELEDKLVVRPTSETIIWYMFGRWIQSYRDLPLMLNQWANVVRWEMRTRPFLRTTEFLWQEGHTAHSDPEEAHDKAREMIQVYRDIAENWLALPVVVGRKSPSERFAGAEETYTIEAMMQNGWALQAGTSHFLGQNFAKAFDVQYKAADGTEQHVWATSWGMTTRMIGALIMTHSDDVGLVLPPNVAPIQIVLVLIFKNEKEQEVVTTFSKMAADRLRAVGIRVEVDDRPNMRPGAKYYEWERKGVPLRMEIGPRDAGKGAVFAAKRIGGQKWSIPIDDAFENAAQEVLADIHTEMLENARQRLMERTSRPSSYEELKQSLEHGGESQGFSLVPWTCDAENEKKVKEETKATLRCYPMDEQDDVEGRTCIYSGKPATHMAIFARAY